MTGQREPDRARQQWAVSEMCFYKLHSALPSQRNSIAISQCNAIRSCWILSWFPTGMLLWEKSISLINLCNECKWSHDLSFTYSHLFFFRISLLCFSTPFLISLFLPFSLLLHLINLFIDAPHTPRHKTWLFVMTELDRQERGQTSVSHKTQHVNPTVNSDPKGNKPLGVHSISLTHILLWYITKILQYKH